MERKKVLLVVVDACTPRVLDAGIEAGRLPHLERLRQAGFYDDSCAAIFPSITPAATASIVTGRYPAEHGIVGAHWYDVEDGEVIYYGDDLSVIWSQGIGRYFERLLVGLNGERLEAETLFDAVERAGLSAASINHLIFRGPRSHKVHVPFLLRLLPGVPRTRQVPGPSRLYLGDFVSTPLPNGRPPRHASGPWHRFGMDDRGTADVLVQLVRAGLPDLTVAYFPDYDFRAHEIGPWDALPALEAFDGYLGRVFHAAGGLDALLKECCVVLTSDHSQSAVRPGDGGEFSLPRALRGLSVADAGRPWQEGDDVKLCVNMRAAQAYLRHPSPELLARCARLFLEHPHVDQVLWRLPNGEAGYQVATQDRGWLRFWQGAMGTPGTAGGPRTVRDPWGQPWGYEGDLDALGAELSPDGALRSHEYPNPFERIAGGLEAPDAGDLWVTAVPGIEFTLEETDAHRGGGAHGSLHVADSQTPLFAAGLPEGLHVRPPTRTVDVAPLCLAVLGLAPERPLGGPHGAAVTNRRGRVRAAAAPHGSHTK